MRRPSCSRRYLEPVTVPAPPRKVSLSVICSSCECRAGEPTHAIGDERRKHPDCNLPRSREERASAREQRRTRADQTEGDNAGGKACNDRGKPGKQQKRQQRHRRTVPRNRQKDQAPAV